MKDDWVSSEKLLVAKSNKGCRKICRWVWYMLKNEEPYGNTSRKTNGQWDAEKAIDTSNSWIYHNITVSSREWCNIGSMQ